MKEKKQLNVRVCTQMADAVGQISERLGLTKDDIGEVAYASLLGSKDIVIRAKRKKISDAVRELQLSFDEAEFQMTGIAA